MNIARLESGDIDSSQVASGSSIGPLAQRTPGLAQYRRRTIGYESTQGYSQDGFVDFSRIHCRAKKSSIGLGRGQAAGSGVFIVADKQAKLTPEFSGARTCTRRVFSC